MSLFDKTAAGDPLLSVFPTQVDDTDNGATIDMDAYTSLGMDFAAFQIIGAVSGTTPSLAGKIQESVDGVVWTDIAGAAFTAVTTSNSNQMITGVREQRYLRHKRTVSGTNPTFVLTAGIIPLITPIEEVADMPATPLTGTATYTVLPAPGEGFRYIIKGYNIGSTAAETVKFQSVLASPLTTTDLSGPIPLAANSPNVSSYVERGLFVGGDNESIKLVKSGAGALGGYISWDKVPV